MAEVREKDIVERFGDRAARWAFIRPKKPETLPIELNRGRIYVLPTGFGLFVTGVIAVLLLGALNYNNNPAIFLAFIIAAAAHNSLVHAHLLLSGLGIKALHSEPVHVGQTMQLRIRFEAKGARDRLGLELVCGDAEEKFDLLAREEIEISLSIPTIRRGWMQTGRMRLSTIRPLGLARAWSWIRPDTMLLVYPAMETLTPALPEDQGEGSQARMHAQGEHLHQLREYRHGDARKQIAWKASARSEHLLVREYETQTAKEVQLDWFSLASMPYEARISRLARWVVNAEQSACRYSLRLPHESIASGNGLEHRHACLRALALMPHV
ncbi:MAG: DUF58 domain-containing protein [Arenimonas sp.]